jgi:hypothetical protein
MRCGTMTEFYDFWDRDDVCRVGEHVVERVTTHEIRRGELVVSVRVCPEHHDALRVGWQGWTLVA